LLEAYDDGIVVVVAWVYILRCSDGSLYVGHTSDLDSRELAHNQGRGGAYTAARRPVTLLYAEEASSLEEARRRERQLKRWSHQKKEALIAQDVAALKRLSRSCGRLATPSSSSRGR
jgi:predicted GIY-YIG superfamily endonuclease